MTGHKCAKWSLNFLIAILLTGMLLPCLSRPVDARALTVGVVTDGSSEPINDLSKRFEAALKALSKGEITVRFTQRAAFSAGWRAAYARGALESALRDPQVDAVLANGPLVSARALAMGASLKKPVVGLFTFDPAYVIPRTQAQARNLALVVVAGQIKADLEAMAGMFRGGALTILVDSVLLQSVPGLQEKLVAAAASHQMQATVLPLGLTAGETLQGLGGNPGPVYLTPGLRMTPEQRVSLIKGLEQRKFMVFSGAGVPDVKQGALAGQLPAVGELLARTAALRMMRFARKRPQEGTIEAVTVARELTINDATALAVGYAISSATAAEAVEIGSGSLQPGEAGAMALTYAGAVQLALENNALLGSNKAEVLEKRQDRNGVITDLLPQVKGGFLYLRFDNDLASQTLDILPENSVYAGVSVAQSVFNDPLISGLRAENKSLESSELEREALRLDVAAKTEHLYLDCLAAAARFRIAENNLDLTRKNLATARARRAAGTVGPQEVYRWEAKEADAHAQVTGARALHKSMMIALNQVMSQDQETWWSLEPRSPADLTGTFNEGEFEGVITSAGELSALQDNVVRTALASSPELNAIDRLIKAETIMKNMSIRRFFVPEVGLGFLYYYILDRTSSQLFGISIPTEKKNHYLLGITAAWPLFEGGGKIVDLKKAKAKVQRLSFLRTDTRQRIEQQAREAVIMAVNARSDMNYARKAAESARKNLKLVTNAYDQGMASLLDQLDAQDVAVAQELGLTIAEYNYLKAVVDVNRAMARNIPALESPESDEARNQPTSTPGGSGLRP